MPWERFRDSLLRSQGLNSWHMFVFTQKTISNRVTALLIYGTYCYKEMQIFTELCTVFNLWIEAASFFEAFYPTSGLSTVVSEEQNRIKSLQSCENLLSAYYFIS